MTRQQHQGLHHQDHPGEYRGNVDELLSELRQIEADFKTGANSGDVNRRLDAWNGEVDRLLEEAQR